MASKQTIETVKLLHNFLSEFEFEGIDSARFYNTFFWHVQNGGDTRGFKYIKSYFELINNPYTTDVVKKMESPEFKDILERALKVLPAKKINNKLEIYYGNPGVGKTMKVIKENPNTDIMVCNSDFEPNDLLESFDVENAKKELQASGISTEVANDMMITRNSDEKSLLFTLVMLSGGKPKYKPTALLNAIKQGKPVILDEIGKLSKQCQDFLVGFTDNKEYFEFKGERIKIAEGFKIIGTMNLEINGNIYDLQTPLVDRATKLEEIKPNINMLAKLSVD